jgi:DNA-binding Lrp family transcriptional regulator
VDDLDLDILRWMYRGGVWSPWGTDPRITLTEIASHVGLDRTAVWSRIRSWRREGFWDGFEVHTNLAIFGVGLAYAEIQVADAAEGWALFDKLEPVEGVLGASLHYGDSATTRNVDLVAVMIVLDNRIHIERRMGMLRKLSPSGNVNGPLPLESPPCSRELTPLDWRIIAVIVANPNVSPSHAAELVGVTRKTFIRHHSALLDDRIVSYAPRVDWSKLGCVTLGFYCRADGDVDRVRRELEAHFPHMIPMSLEGMGTMTPEYDPASCFAVIVPARSPHEVPTLVRDLSRLDGVKMVRPELWGPSRPYYRWIDQRIARQLANSTVAAARVNVVPSLLNPRRNGYRAPEHANGVVVTTH